VPNEDSLKKGMIFSFYLLEILIYSFIDAKKSGMLEKSF